MQKPSFKPEVMTEITATDHNTKHHAAESKPATSTKATDVKTDQTLKDPIEQNVKIVLIGAAVVLAVTAVTASVYNQKQKRQVKAQELLYLADKKQKDEGVRAQNEKISGDASTVFPESIQSYQKIIRDFSGTLAAFEAQLKLGDLYQEKGPIHLAIASYEAAVQSAPKKWERLLALYSLGYAYEANKEYPKAIEQFRKAMDLKEGMKGELMLALARNQILAGAPDQAKKTYEQMMSELANTPYAKEAEIRKERLE
jgi:tetratricopeptide (TPR) repeat protein